jgi:hypothetical protein
VDVFISWSGDLSKQLASAIHRWLPNVLQFVKPYFTPSDIDKGARWLDDITKKLSHSSFGIIVLTADNLQSPWINFEAGAISCTVEQARVCPIVFGMKPTDVDGPLAQFQASRFTNEDIHRLVRTINDAATGDKKLLDSVVDSAFDMWWPRLEADVNTILKNAATPHAPQEMRSDRELMEETLSLIRSMNRFQDAFTMMGSLMRGMNQPMPPDVQELVAFLKDPEAVARVNEELKARKRQGSSLAAPPLPPD